MRYRVGPGLLLALLATGQLQAQRPSTDGLDAFIKGQIDRRRIPGLSLAIIDSGKIVYAHGYGVRDVETKAPVTPTTLFQAGSISKPVSALGVLHLVERNSLSLDDDVNRKLVSWKVPENQFTQSEKVTLRRILSHNAGLTVHGFPGYAVNEPVPTLVQVLDGKAPANTAPIVVDTTPGAIGRYSGGGFTVMQQLIIDVARQSFPAFMQKTVLGPIGMTQSSYEQPQTADRAAQAASGYYPLQEPVVGRWHLYPEMAAAGLWTTPGDLARFVIEIQQTLAGKGHGVISPAMARQYLTPQKEPFGLGIAVEGSGPSLRFSHNGRDEGFDAFLYADTQGRGVVMMINANDNSRMMGRILKFIAQSYQWPREIWKYGDPAVSQGPRLDRNRLLRYSGYYEVGENQMQAFGPGDEGPNLVTFTDALPDETFRPVDSVHFVSEDRDLAVNFVLDSTGEATALLRQLGSTDARRVPRVAPLPSSRHPSKDPDPGIWNAIPTLLSILRAGGSSLDRSAMFTPGAKRDFAAGMPGLFQELSAFAYLGEERVAGRGIWRHGAEVDRVRFYSVTLDGVERYLLIHLTARGELTDYDLVNW